MEQACITQVINYIEAHLKEELDNKSLARISGYSEYHFIRLFRKYVRLTPADYIRKRRISEIVCRIGETNRSMSDVAFEYGFNSKENFTRAFKREHNILPTEWKSVNCSLRLFLPFEFEPEKQLPKISIAYLKGFSLTVYNFGGEFPPDCWNKYNAQRLSCTLSGGNAVEDYGAMMWDNGEKKLNYYIGIATENAKGDISGTLQLEIPEGTYAVFDTPPSEQKDFVINIRNTWDWIYKEWFPASGFERGEGYELESYTETSRKYTERIYIPIKRRA